MCISTVYSARDYPNMPPDPAPKNSANFYENNVGRT